MAASKKKIKEYLEFWTSKGKEPIILIHFKISHFDLKSRKHLDRLFNEI